MQEYEYTIKRISHNDYIIQHSQTPYHDEIVAYYSLGRMVELYTRAGDLILECSVDKVDRKVDNYR